ncbi:MAG: copper oxidase [Planctomycetes bacterium]|nr:copper oxidase [Planctomycetota bacterium]
MPTRRDILTSTAVLAGGAMLSRLAPARAADTMPTTLPIDADVDPGVPGRDYTPVVTPNNVTLPYKLVDGVKVMHLIAEEVDHEFAPGLRAKCWGYNGRTPGPTIEAVEGDRLRIFVTNRLPEPTTIHWHGVLLPSGMDGVSGLTQKPIAPGETFRYEFTLRQHGTQMYHPHFDEMTQVGLGMMGMFIIHPRRPEGPRIDRDFVFMLSEWRIRPGTSRPDPTEMTDFNVLTFNHRAYPGTDALVARLGDRVRMRFGNLSAMDHHPIHLHGHRFKIVGTDAGPIPASAQWPEVTVLVPVGSTRAVEFSADNSGDWAMHCHMVHHMMNQMGHGLPNLLGVNTAGIDDKIAPLLPSYMTMGETGMGGMGEMGMSVPRNSLPMRGGPGPFGYIDMGGMFTVLKVRDGITGYDDPGWYKHPDGSVAGPASVDELKTLGLSAP